MQQSSSDNDMPVILEMPNNLKDKVTLGGSIKGKGFDQELLARADAHVAKMADALLEAMDCDLERLEHTCRKAENEASMREIHFVELEKIAHEIKGYGSSVGFDLLTTFGGSLSGVLRKSNLSEPMKLTLSRAHVDSMSLVFRRQIKGDGGDAGEQLTAALDQAVSKFQAAK